MTLCINQKIIHEKGTLIPGCLPFNKYFCNAMFLTLPYICHYIFSCNKVTCTNCHKCMCWTCQKPISGYDHFQDSRCNTFSTHETFDNTDIRHPLQYGLYHNPPPPRPAPVLNQVCIFWIFVTLAPLSRPNVTKMATVRIYS